MADQNFMDLASKTASGIQGTDYMMLVNNSEAYKALVNDVAEAILSKLTSKSFSGLETTAKNVIGALNELNSNFKMDSNVTIDCNEVTDFLTFCNDDSQNLPIKTFGILMTLTRDQNVRLQIFGNSTAENNMYTRTKKGGKWTAWYRFQLQPVEQS